MRHCTLAELLEPLCTLTDAIGAMHITHLQLDSRLVAQGDTFIAIDGHAVDGRRFIPMAIQQGAALVIAQADTANAHGQLTWQDGVPVVSIFELDNHLSLLASRLYQFSSQLIAVTGTNGKTTITQLIAQWIDLLTLRCAVMGTTGNGFLDNLQPAANTTGSAIDIQRTLSELSQQGADYAALEVSSHGLVQGRVKTLPFAVGIFTNLSRDHLDYHGTMEEYANAKRSLFTQHDCLHAIFNVDDAVGQQWLTYRPDAVAVSLCAEPKTKQKIWATQLHYSTQGIDIHFNSSWGEGMLSAPLIGEFNANNLLVALACLLTLGFEKEALLACASRLQPVLGRMELFAKPMQANIVVDYAHTPDALEKALMALRVHCDGDLWVIAGCGGDRDKGKRPLMASMAEALADQVIFTDDNPRSESPVAIINDMLAGVKRPEYVHVKHQRFDAIAFALAHASPHDIILVAGKGHEDYQIFADKTVHYSDRESAQQLLGLTL